MTEPINLGPRIKAARIALGLTEEELARRLGVARGTVRNFEGQGKRLGNPTYRVLLALKRAGLDMDAIVPELLAPGPSAESAAAPARRSTRGG